MDLKTTSGLEPISQNGLRLTCSTKALLCLSVQSPPGFLFIPIASFHLINYILYEIICLPWVISANTSKLKCLVSYNFYPICFLSVYATSIFPIVLHNTQPLPEALPWVFQHNLYMIWFILPQTTEMSCQSRQASPVMPLSAQTTEMLYVVQTTGMLSVNPNTWNVSVSPNNINAIGQPKELKCFMSVQINELLYVSPNNLKCFLPAQTNKMLSLSPRNWNAFSQLKKLKCCISVQISAMFYVSPNDLNAYC